MTPTASTQGEAALREQICKVGAEMYRFRLVDNHAGNISARLGADRLLITPSGLSKGFMQPDDLIVIDMQGRRVDSPTERNAAYKPSTETPMHLAAYHHRDDIGAVVHAHPPYAVALTIAGIDLQRYVIPEAVVHLGRIPTLPYATPSSDEDAEVIADVVHGHDAMMLSHHGSLTVGRDPWHAYMRLETLEHIAHLTFLVQQLGGGRPLPEAALAKLVEQRAHFGLTRPGERLTFYE